MTPKLFVLATLLALPVFALAGKSLYFTSPSGNIFCMGDSRLEYGNSGEWGVTCELSGHRSNIQPPQNARAMMNARWIGATVFR